jgi:Tfp pilus assembly protein PilF
MTLLLALLIGCAPKAPLDDAPDWQSTGGQERVRAELIQALLDQGNYREALILIATSRERGDDHPDLDLFQAQALLGTGLPSEAMRLLEAYSRREPRDPRAFRSLGLLHADAQRLPEAEASFRRATELDDRHADTWNNLGFVILAAGRPVDAVQPLQRAVALDGTQLRYRNNLGFALARSGRLSEALEAFLSVGSAADAHANLALALELSGDAVSAADHYGRALEIEPEHASAREAMTRLHPEPQESP